MGESRRPYAHVVGIKGTHASPCLQNQVVGVGLGKECFSLGADVDVGPQANDAPAHGLDPLDRLPLQLLTGLLTGGDMVDSCIE